MDKYFNFEEKIEDFFKKQELSVIKQKEESSLNNFCKKNGFGADWFKSEWCKRTADIIVEREEQTLVRYQQSLGSDINNDILDKIRSFQIKTEKFKNNFWEFLWSLKWEEKKKLSYSITHNMINDKRIDWDYLRDVAKIRGLNLNKNAKDSFYKFLLTIPWINYFDVTYNAFCGSWNSPFGKIPFIADFPHLYETLDLIVESVLNIIFEKDTDGCSILMRNTNKISELLSSPELKVMGILAVHALLSKTAIFNAFRLKGTIYGNIAIDFPFPLYFAKNSAKSFVAYHEYAHFLAGHLNHTHKIHFENEADDIAIEIIEKECLAGEMTGEMIDWKAVGLLISMRSLEIIENYYGGDQTTHPRAFSRFMKVFNRYENYFIQRFTNAFSAIFNIFTDNYSREEQRGPITYESLKRHFL